jgi:two-component system phosphate regulon response regulator PhoB
MLASSQRDVRTPALRRESYMFQSRPNLLVVMPDDVTSLVRYILEEEGYHISIAERVNGNCNQDCDSAVDLVILDAALFEDQTSLREQVNHVIGDGAKPMLLLVEGSSFPTQASLATERESIEILQRPLSANQLIERVRTLLRKSKLDGHGETLSLGDVRIDLDTYRVYRNGRRVELGPIEFRLLCHLMTRSPAVLSRQDLITAVWPRNVLVEPRTVDAHVGRLRRALTGRGETDLIRTVRSAGYSFDFND